MNASSPLAVRIGKPQLLEFVQYAARADPKKVIYEEFEPGQLIFREKQTFLENKRCGVVVSGEVGLYGACKTPLEEQAQPAELQELMAKDPPTDESSPVGQRERRNRLRRSPRSSPSWPLLCM